jgi:hypothetical protein
MVVRRSSPSRTATCIVPASRDSTARASVVLPAPESPVSQTVTPRLRQGISGFLLVGYPVYPGAGQVQVFS